MGGSAAFEPAPRTREHIALAARAKEPPASSQARSSGPAGGLLRRSQIPEPAATTWVPEVASPGDRLAADFTQVRVHTDRAAQAPASAGDTVQRATATVEGGPAGQHSRRRGGRRGDGTAPAQRSTVREVLASAGQPLAAPLRREMEARLGADFSHVRTHTDRAAQQSAAGIGARAYTSGSHVVIGDGGADPHTLAHELTHVIQQRTGPVSGARNDDTGGLRLSGPEDRFERAAEANAHRARTGPTPDLGARLAPGPAGAPTPAGGTIQLTRATVEGGAEGGSAGNLRPLGEGNVAMGGTGGQSHAEQKAWSKASATVLEGVRPGGGGSYAVVFNVDTKICDACREWFDGRLYDEIRTAATPVASAGGTSTAAGASQGPVAWTLEVSVNGHRVRVTGTNTVWPPEVADTHTFGRLGDVGRSLRLLSDRRDAEGRLTGNAAAPPYTAHAETHAQQLQANNWSNPANTQILQQALTAARTSVAGNGRLQANYGKTPAELLTTLTSATLHEGVLSGTLRIDDLLTGDPVTLSEAARTLLHNSLRERFEAWLETYLEVELEAEGTKNVNVHMSAS